VHFHDAKRGLPALVDFGQTEMFARHLERMADEQHVFLYRVFLVPL
jgi:transcriptional regulatory protein LevR